MKYYETTCEDYQISTDKYNIHSELTYVISNLPSKLQDFKNIVLYGPPGSGKYTVALSILHRYSSLKYEKKISIFNEKNDKKVKTTKQDKKNSQIPRKVDFVYKLSDIHYEIDISLLGCNAKVLWNEIFFQIVDIISVTPKKIGVIVCKNFQYIYNEFLDIFHSYINHLSNMNNITIRFILLTEHVSFIPNNVLQHFDIISVKSPSVEEYHNMIQHHTGNIFCMNKHSFMSQYERKSIEENIEHFGSGSLDNIKEIHSLKYPIDKIPKNIFNIIVDDIIERLMKPDTLDIQQFRNILYDMLIYNLDIFECITHIIFYLIENNVLEKKYMKRIIIKLYSFFKYFNNNYRPIYHLESIFFEIITVIYLQQEDRTNKEKEH